MMFKSLTQKPFSMEKSSVRRGYFKVLEVFSVQFWLESGKIFKNNNQTCLSPWEMSVHLAKQPRVLK